MKPDTQWPCAPLPHRPASDTPPPELTEARERAVRRLELMASFAEEFCTGREIVETDSFRTPGEFVTACMNLMSGQEKVSALNLVGVKKAKAVELAAEDPTVMVIDVRRHWGVSGLTPIRGDIAFFQGGHVAIVTEPQCRGCRTFKCAEMTPTDAEGIPRLVISEHWESTVTHLVRLVIEEPIEEPTEGTEATED
jgi:hypothetical protein